MAEPLQALVFDAYGTLFDTHSVAAKAEEFFPGSGDSLSRLWRLKQIEYTWLRSLMNRYEDFWSVTGAALDFACQNLRLQCDAARRETLMQEYLRLKIYPDVKPALAGLAALPLFILSNGSPKMLRPLVENAGLATTFSGLLSVDDVKIYKPAPRVYQLAVEATGFDARRIGFVSSNSWDVAGATSFGFRTFWINRAGAIPDALGVKAGATLNTLAELPAASRT